MMTTSSPRPDAQPALPVPPDDVLQQRSRPAGPASMQRRLWFVYPLAFIGINAVWGGVIQILLGTQVADFVGRDDAPATLGIVTGIAAVSSVVSQPVMGILSDRTRSRFGRRNIWVAGAAVVAVVGLVATSLSPSVPVLAVVWAISMWPLNALQGALTAVLPERIPVRHRGSVSGLVGATGVIGTFSGVAIAGLSGNVIFSYAAIAVIVLVTSLVFTFTTTDYFPPETREQTEEERKAAARLPSFRADRDYWWAFISRFMMIFGVFLVGAFQLYILQNYVKFGDQSIEAASAALVGLSGVSAIALVVFSLLGGWISDKAGRLRIFVAGATLMLVPAALVYWLVPTYTGALVANAITGAGFGLYLSVDQALISRVLPNVENAARDLGIMNIANAGPQIIAPVVGGILVTLLGGYEILFIGSACFVVVSAILVTFIRSVR